MSHFESIEEHIEVVVAKSISKPVPDQEMDEDYLCLSPDSVHLTTFVNSLDWLKVL